MFHGSQEPLYMSPGAPPPPQEPVYMSPLEPPLSVYGGGTVSDRDGLSIYGTMPRTLRGDMYGSQFNAHQHGGGYPAQSAAMFTATQYATLRGKQRLSARPSLRSLGLMDDEEAEDKVRVLEDMEHQDTDDSSSEEDASIASLKEKLKDENLNRITRGITFQTLRTNGKTTTSTLHIPMKSSHNLVVIIHTHYRILLLHQNCFHSILFRFDS